MPTDIPDTGSSLFDDLVAGLAALDMPADGGRLIVGRSADAEVVVEVAAGDRIVTAGDVVLLAVVQL